MVFEDYFIQKLSVFLIVFSDKTRLICSFISLLLNSFDLPNYDAESRERCTLKLLLCLEVEDGVRCSCVQR